MLKIQISKLRVGLKFECKYNCGMELAKNNGGVLPKICSEKVFYCEF